MRGYQVFAVALAAAEVPRVLAMVGYQPAVLFRKGTFGYLWRALQPSPTVINPSGDSRFLRVLRPFHLFVLVVTLQHLTGRGTAAMVYAVLSHRHGIPAIPFICLAAALSFWKPGPEKVARAAPAEFPGHG